MAKMDFETAMDLFISTGYCGCNSEFFEEINPPHCKTVIVSCRICKTEHGRYYPNT